MINNKKKNIILVGGAGYIGTILIKYFLAKKFKVTVIDNLLYSNKFAIQKYFKNKNFKFLNADMRNKNSYKNILKKGYAVVLLAGLVGDPITKKYKTLSKSINSIGVRKFIKECYKLKNINRLIFVSTCSNYGLSNKKNILLNEKSRLNPLSIYAKQKVEIEKFLINLKKNKFLSPCILRFATAFGLSPRMRFDLTVNHFTKSFINKEALEIYDPNTWRPYCHVKDFARLIHKVIVCKKELISHQIFNAGNNKNNFTKKGILKKVQKLLPRNKVIFRKKDVDRRNYRVDFKKVKKILNFTTKYSLDYGIKEIFKAYKNKNFVNIKHQLGNYNIKNAGK
tara:strand:+ start:6421 stop:7434 length:1014 start_codon:yes stop_codon:yes gene_type:complete